MNKNNLFFFLAGSTSLVLGGCLLFQGIKNNDNKNPDKEPKVFLKSQLETENSKNRNLELSEATKVQTEVPNEPKIIMNDPALSLAWGHEKTDAQKAWELSMGGKNIKVCVIDTGVDINHEDLKDNIWVNPGESGLDTFGKSKSNNGIDDDENGFIDDVHGWNFVNNNNDLTDNHGHGTHISGIIGAVAGNGKGVAGIAPQVTLVNIKYFDPKVSSSDVLASTIKAIDYSVTVGCEFINYSGGGTEYSQEEKSAIDRARTRGVLFIGAAGNNKANSDVHKYYPADYGLENIISVTAIDPKTEVLSSSNFGIETVDLAAPGQSILSTMPNNTYGEMTGTSQATAFVTGAAVLIKGLRPQFNYSDMKKYILSTGDQRDSLALKTKTARKLNLFKSLTMLDESTSASGLVVKGTSNEQFNNSNNGNIVKGAERGIAAIARELEKKMNKSK